MMKTLTYALVIAHAAFVVPALSIDYPHELVGEWVRLHGGSEDSLYVAVNGGSLSIENHLDGEGYACILPIAKLKMQRIKEGVQEIVLTSGTATCHAEENPSEKHVVVLLYSRRATTRGDRSETLVFAGWGDTEMLKRK